VSQDSKSITPQEGTGWRSRVYMIGGLIGALLGLISAYLYVRSAEEALGDEPPVAPATGDAVRVGMSLLSVVRAITEWGRR